jgi:hypothetical protein
VGDVISEIIEDDCGHLPHGSRDTARLRPQNAVARGGESCGQRVEVSATGGWSMAVLWVMVVCSSRRR